MDSSVQGKEDAQQLLSIASLVRDTELSVNRRMDRPFWLERRETGVGLTFSSSSKIILHSSQDRVSVDESRTSGGVGRETDERKGEKRERKEA